MLSLWYLLKQKFYHGSPAERTARCVLLVAKLLFWWMYIGDYLDSPQKRKSFAAFFSLEEKQPEI